MSGSTHSASRGLTPPPRPHSKTIAQSVKTRSLTAEAISDIAKAVLFLVLLIKYPLPALGAHLTPILAPRQITDITDKPWRAMQTISEPLTAHQKAALCFLTLIGLSMESPIPAPFDTVAGCLIAAKVGLDFGMIFAERLKRKNVIESDK